MCVYEDLVDEVIELREICGGNHTLGGNMETNSKKYFDRLERFLKFGI